MNGVRDYYTTEGRQEGEQIGITKGRHEGDEQRVLKVIANALKADKLTVVEIAELVDKDIAFVQNIQNKFNHGKP